MNQPTKSTEDIKNYVENEPICSTSEINQQNEISDEVPVDKPNYLNNIPTLVAHEIIKQLDSSGVLALAATCKQWNTWITNAPQKYKPVLVAPFITFAGGKVLKFKQRRNDIDYEMVINYDDVFKFYKYIDCEEVIYDPSDDTEEIKDRDGLNKIFDFLIENEDRMLKKTLNIIDGHHTEVDENKLSAIIRMFPRLKLTELHEDFRHTFQKTILGCLDSVALTVVYELDTFFFLQYAMQVYSGKRPNFETITCNMRSTDNEFAYMNYETLRRLGPANISCKPDNFHIHVPTLDLKFYLEFTPKKYMITVTNNYPDS